MPSTPRTRATSPWRGRRSAASGSSGFSCSSSPSPATSRSERPADERLELARAAFAEIALAEVQLEEQAYTVDSLRVGGFDPDSTVFLIGADEFTDFLTWKEPDEILDRVRLGVATRPGYPRGRLLEVLGALRRPDRVELFEIPAVDVSSRDLRARLAGGEPATELLPPAVARRVVERGLYHEGC